MIEIGKFQLGDQTVGNYYFALRGMWEELSHSQPFPTFDEWREYVENQHIYFLLKGPSPESESIREIFCPQKFYLLWDP